MSIYKYTAVIINTHITDLLYLTLKDFYSKLNNEWSFLIVCNNINIHFLVNLLLNNFKEDIYRTTVLKLNINNHFNHDNSLNGFIKYDYNLLLTSKELYEMIKTETILFFQVNTLLSDNNYSNIYNYLDYDYVSSPNLNSNNYTINNLSLRKKSKMLEIINDSNYNIQYNNKYYLEHEYFKAYPNILIPDNEISKTFCVKDIYYNNPIGIDSAFNFLNDNQLKELEINFPNLFELKIKYNNFFEPTSNLNIPIEKSNKSHMFINHSILQF